MQSILNFTRVPRRLAVVLAGLFAGWLSEPLAPGQSTNLVLTNASEILALPADRAYGINVLIRGVVTAAQPGAEWGGRFFVQDATSGVFVENIGTNQPTPGDFVEIAGISHPGGYAPIITRPRWRKLGTAPLPEAKPVPIEQLMSGIEDSQRVEISGIVRAFRSRGAVIVFEIASGGYRLDVNAPPSEGVDPQTLIGAKVRIRGTAATFYSGQLRHLITVSLHVPRAEDFVVEKTEPGDPFNERVIPLDSLAQYRRGREPGRRVHVKGTVTYQRLGEDLFLQDATGGMQVKCSMLEPVTPGEVVEAVGFPNFEQFLPVLQDAVFRKTKEPRQEPSIKAVTIPELQGGFRHADLVTIQGRVLDNTERRVRRPGGGLTGQQTVLTLQNSNFLFSVEGPATTIGDEISAPIGSLVEVSGVCLMKIAEDGKLQSLLVLLPNSTCLRILQAPGWWTPQRLLLGLAGSFTVLVVSLSWIVMVSRRNTALKVSIREKEQAQIGLQHAHDHLEERVKERTEQLKLQITARQESELQFKAVLHERTRLAQELHDTLEQTLTGIALQMDTASKFAQSEKERANHHLELARNLVTQSQTEVRCSVWDLRSRSLEQIDLAGLLLKISKQLTDDTSIKVQVNAVGRVRPLSELIEENLLRVAQEALTNIIKHSRATQASITLDYGPQNVILTIRDNGVGFVVDQQAGPREGHFGLLGVSERTTRLRGKVSVVSEPGKGTTVQVIIPIENLMDLGLIESQLGAQL
ncbi:MAG: histidine kinase [Verrucomicrobiales bacterium]|nr:histidine kinase [Verrucomicrobiales bacterium]